MNHLQKRKRQDSDSVSQSLADREHTLYNLIRSKKNMGISIADMKREIILPANVFKKTIDSLQSKNLIKEILNIKNKRNKHYMASQFEPSNEITGGDWYSEGNLDMEFINAVKNVCFKYIFNQKVATFDGVLHCCNNSGIFSAELITKQIEEVLRSLVLDDKITEVKSNGFGEFANVPVGRVCYRWKSKGGVKGEQNAGAMASIPCGVCPRINFCTPDGVISHRTCVYYDKWSESLDF